MSRESVLADGRRAAAALMPSTGKIGRRTGAKTTGADGMDVDVWEVLYADHPVRLRDASTGSRGSAGKAASRSAQGVDVSLARHILSLAPFGDAGTRLDLADGDVVELTSGENIGAFVRITESDWADDKTSRRVGVEACETPRGWS